MAKSKGGNKIGGWAFLIGVILAVLLGLIAAFNGGSIGAGMTYVMIVLGIIVGLLNIADEETTPFLMSGAVLVIVSALGQNVISGVGLFEGILSALILLFVPATIIVALKHVFSLARN